MALIGRCGILRTDIKGSGGEICISQQCQEAEMNKNKELFDLCTNCLTRELPVLRKMAGFTQADMGEILGVSRQTITNIESGTSKMKWTTFLALMFIFSLDHNTSEYLRTIDLPYPQLKEWLLEKQREERTRGF